jgi:hypothetical protein
VPDLAIEVPAIPDAMPEFTTTYDIDPHAGTADFDDAAWPSILPTDLAAKRGGGKVSFLWFRTPLTIPPRIGAFDPAGAKVVLALCVDDYAEIWVNGALPRAAVAVSVGRGSASRWESSAPIRYPDPGSIGKTKPLFTPVQPCGAPSSSPRHAVGRW